MRPGKPTSESPSPPRRRCGVGSAAKTTYKCPTGSFDGMPTRQMARCTLLRNLLDADARSRQAQMSLDWDSVRYCTFCHQLPPSPGYTSLPMQDRYGQSTGDRARLWQEDHVEGGVDHAKVMLRMRASRRGSARRSSAENEK